MAGSARLLAATGNSPRRNSPTSVSSTERAWFSTHCASARSSSPAVWKRFDRSRSSARQMAASSSGGTSGLSRAGGTMVLSCTARRTAISESPWNRRPPVSSSHSTTPSANTSVRASTLSPRACSGDMYANLPLSTPGLVSVLPAFAMPKSVSFTAPS
ncbi:hypothetical protein COSO111634_31930 [Corallococcus soli]